jgi:hypothetical protein
MLDGWVRAMYAGWKIMAQGILALCIFLFIIMAEGVDAQSQSGSQAYGDPTAIASSENNDIEILGLDPTAFPKMKFNIFIDKFCALSGNLKRENFKVKEDANDIAIDNFYFTGNASGHKLDLAIVFDDTGSMEQEINAMKSKVKELTESINASGIDATYSLVSFKDSVSVKTNWTSDSAAFKNSVESLSAVGGDDEPEVSLDAIEAVLSMGFRPDAQKVVLVITDAHAHYRNDSTKFSIYTQEEIEQDLRGSGVTLVLVSPRFDSGKGVDLRQIANDIQNTWIDINSADFSTILDQFKGIITGTYVIEYTSPDLTPGKNRTSLVVVNAPGCVVGSDSIAFASPGSENNPNRPPAIHGMTSDKASPQDAGMAINWTANADDPNGDLILYKFFLDGRPMTPWAEDRTWIWMPGQAGHYRVEVQVRDAKHAGPDEQDDRRAESFTINEPKTAIPENQPPVVDELLAMQSKAKEITWAANATDSDGDQILYRYFLNNKSMTDWIDRNKWILNANEADAGENQVEVQIRDGAHAGPDGYDDSKSVKFNLSSMKLMMQTWKKTFGGPDTDEGYSVQQTSDGGYIVAGRASDDADIWLIKTDSSGNMQWDKSFGGSGLDLPGSVQQTDDGGYAIFAQTTSYGAGGRDAWLIKTDSSGNMQWDKTFGGKEDEPSFLGQQTSDGGYIITGSTWSYGEGMGDILLIKTDQNGSVLWDRTFGGSWIDSSDCIKQTNDGGYIIGGLTFPSSRDEDQRGWLIKTDANGNEIWTKTLSKGQGNVASVQQTADGGYIIAGSVFSFGPTGLSSGSLLMKTDSLGNEEWTRTFNGNFESVHQTSEGGYVAAGSFSHNSYLTKTDSKGNLEWEKTLTHGGSGFDKAASVQQTNDGGYILTGSAGYMAIEGPDAYGSYAMGGDDVLLIKTDPNGNV